MKKEISPGMKSFSKNSHIVVGMMSGTSLDGMDLIAAAFNRIEERWVFDILAAETVSYPEEWQNRLSGAHHLSGEQLVEMHHSYGRWIGGQIIGFNKEHGLRPGLIASHGHTIFHQPERGFTFQAGSGADIAAVTGIPTVADFRPGDIALGGQGAPLVPVGDRLLFPDYLYCLNLGGFANISYEEQGRRIAFDICPVNFVLNSLARRQGFAFDHGGNLGRKGNTDQRLLDALNQLPYYRQVPPKSLGREWVEAHVLPLLQGTGISEPVILRTFYEHVAMQISRIAGGGGKMLVTGGGAFNTFLMERIRACTDAEAVVPADEIVSFKEALIFAFLGLLHSMNINNCYASVTGARHDHCTGVFYRP